jgi:hypothetical protein
MRFDPLALVLPKRFRLFGYQKYLALSIPDEALSRKA